MKDFALVPNYVLEDPLLKPSEFRVLVALYSFRNKNADTVWPRVETLAIRSGIKDKTQISKLTTRLAKLGWLTKDRKTSFHGAKKYVLSIPERLLSDEDKAAPSVPLDGETSQVGNFSQVGENIDVNTGEIIQVGNSSQVGEIEPTKLDKTTSSQVGKNYQLYIEQTNRNRPIEQSVADATAASAASPVDNSLVNLKNIYSNPDTRATIFEIGSALLMRGGYNRHQAKNLLAKLMTDYGEGRVLDALVVTLIENPMESRPYLLAVVKKIGDEIPKDWQPDSACQAEIASLGIPEYLIEDARDIFLTWFRSQGIRHTNWSGLFVRWCQGDWDRVQENNTAYQQRLWAGSGLSQDEVKTSWGATM